MLGIQDYISEVRFEEVDKGLATTNSALLFLEATANLAEDVKVTE